MFKTNAVQEIKTHFTFNQFFFNRKSWLLWDDAKNIVEPHRSQMTLWHMRFVCWILNATNTHSEYVIFTAVKLQQWLHERASMLLRTYAACLFVVTNVYCYVEMFTGNNFLRSSWEVHVIHRYCNLHMPINEMTLGGNTDCYVKFTFRIK